MDNEKKRSLSDDEEDLEALRLAALQSLKRKNEAANAARYSSHSDQQFYHGGRPFRGSPNKRGRYFSGRNARNGQLFNSHNSRGRNTNLINLTPVGLVDSTENSRGTKNLSEKDSKFILPQDRYCKIEKDSQEEKTDDTTSKFDRYKDSDKSDDESEEEEFSSVSEDDSPGKLERHDSLEALMQELDDEIQGKSNPKDKDAMKENKPKTKTKSKKKKENKTPDIQENSDGVSDSKIDADKSDSQKDNENLTVESTSEDPVESLASPEVNKEDKDVSVEAKPLEEPLNKRRRLLGHERRDSYNFRGRRGRRSRSPSFIRNRFPPPGMPLPFGPNRGPPPGFNHGFLPPNLAGPPPFFDRPLSPLLINAESLQNQTMAPLSPRSAAFVLQNRAIIEKRKRSPRRSYSRSPSPRSRSISPRSPLRRSISPRRRLRSPSPNPINRPPLSPQRRPLSPTRRPLSPGRRPLSPGRRPLSPARRPLSPSRRPLSPARRPLSPARRPLLSPRRSLSPTRRPLSPTRRPLSPTRRPLSPTRRPLSPTRRPFSPTRRPLSPRRRALSPRQRSVSPRRKPLSPRRRSVSPKRRSMSPKRRSISPKRMNRKDNKIEGRVSPKPKSRVKDRLGQKSSQKTDSKVDKEKSGASVPTPIKESEPEKPLDPVLEARKRKFESKEIKVKEGVIRLKKDEPKMEKIEENKEENVEQFKVEIKEENQTMNGASAQPETEKDPEMLLEEALLADDDDLDLGLHLFSDEDSGSENEGRFKEKEKNNTVKPPVLPFSKLVKSPKPVEVKKPVVPRKIDEKIEKENTAAEELKKEEMRSDTPPIVRKEKEPITFDMSKEEDKIKDVEAPLEVDAPVEKMKKKKVFDKVKTPKTKSKILVKPERHPIEKRKIEIKIKNPAKYEKGGKTKEERKLEKKAKKLLLKMVEAQQPQESEDETIIEEEDEEGQLNDAIYDEEDDNETEAVAGGDLRAQLSKKRAGKVTKIIAPDQVNKRLLQNALQNALLKSSRSRTQEFSNSDGKLPIHLRLGVSGREGTFTGKTKRKSKRRKNRDLEEQV